MFMNPSKHAKTPRYVTPEFSFTITGLPITCFKKSVGFFLVAPDDEASTFTSALSIFATKAINTGFGRFESQFALQRLLIYRQ